MRRLLIASAVLVVFLTACSDTDTASEAADATDVVMASQPATTLAPQTGSVLARDVGVDERGIFGETTGVLLYLLGPAELTGEALDDVTAVLVGQHWMLNIVFNNNGAAMFDAMAVANFGEQVAIVVDGVVQSAPLINATEFGGEAVISAAYNESEVGQLRQALLADGSLLEFRPVLLSANNNEDGRAELEEALEDL